MNTERDFMGPKAMHENKQSWHLKLNSEILLSPDSTQRLSPSDIVYVLVDQQGRPAALPEEDQSGVKSFAAWTSNQVELPPLWPMALRPGPANSHGPTLCPYALDQLSGVHFKQKVAALKINPAVKESRQKGVLEFFAQEMVLYPHFDELTQKYLTCDSNNARALLALNNSDLKRYGFQIVFHALSAQDLPLTSEEKSAWVLEQIDQLAFIMKRTPVPYGHASFFCVLLNLEDPLLEMCFVRSYPTFASHIKPLFITSQLDILDGQAKGLPYNSSHIDGVLRPLLDYYRHNKKVPTDLFH